MRIKNYVRAHYVPPCAIYIKVDSPYLLCAKSSKTIYVALLDIALVLDCALGGGSKKSQKIIGSKSWFLPGEK